MVMTHFSRPIRVLVASRDSRYLNLASFVLARRGFLVESTRKLSRLTETVRRRDPNVVIVDADGADVSRSLEVLRSFAAVLCVQDTQAAPVALRSSPLEKWKPDQLASEIELMCVDDWDRPRALAGSFESRIHSR